MVVPGTGEELGLDRQADCGEEACNENILGAALQMKNHLGENREAQEAAMGSERRCSKWRGSAPQRAVLQWEEKKEQDRLHED